MDTDMGYQIELEGALNESWSDWLIGMDIRHTRGPDGKPRTTLTGVMKDQAMLRGVLDRLFNLGLALVSLQRIPLESKE
jgi:hypothetical protein